MNRTVLLVTHDMDEAIYLSDRILVLDAKKGKVRQEFTVKEENETGSGCMNRALCAGRSIKRSWKVR